MGEGWTDRRTNGAAAGPRTLSETALTAPACGATVVSGLRPRPGSGAGKTVPGIACDGTCVDKRRPAKKRRLYAPMAQVCQCSGGDRVVAPSATSALAVSGGSLSPVMRRMHERRSVVVRAAGPPGGTETAQRACAALRSGPSAGSAAARFRQHDAAGRRLFGFVHHGRQPCLRRTQRPCDNIRCVTDRPAGRAAALALLSGRTQATPCRKRHDLPLQGLPLVWRLDAIFTIVS